MLRRGRRGMMIAVMTLVLTACGGGGGGDSDPSSSGISSNFIADDSPACPASGDALGMRKVSAKGRAVTIGLQVTDCDRSLGIFGVNFEISFDSSIATCDSSNPCSAGTLLNSPASLPACLCDNATGRILGSYTNTGPGGNETVAASGQEDVVRIDLRVNTAGLARVEFLSTGSKGGTALTTLTGSPASAVAIGGLAYVSGTVIGQ